MILSGILLAIAGWIWGWWFPINKALWTSSYVLWTGGLALIVFTLFYWIIDIKGWKKWCKPLEIFGINAIAVYFLHIFFLQLQRFIHIKQANGDVVILRVFITEHLFGWASAQNSALLYSLSYACFWFVVLYILYRNKIFIKV